MVHDYLSDNQTPVVCSETNADGYPCINVTTDPSELCHVHVVPVEVCSAVTRVGSPCKLPGDFEVEGVRFCHVHNPDGASVEYHRKRKDLPSCSSLTKQGLPCPIGADRLTEGKPVCHVHDPAGKAQARIVSSRERKARRSAPLPVPVSDLDKAKQAFLGSSSAQVRKQRRKLRNKMDLADRQGVSVESLYSVHDQGLLKSYLNALAASQDHDLPYPEWLS